MLGHRPKGTLEATIATPAAPTRATVLFAAPFASGAADPTLGAAVSALGTAGVTKLGAAKKAPVSAAPQLFWPRKGEELRRRPQATRRALDMPPES